jgi:integration host factor subunit beta
MLKSQLVDRIAEQNPHLHRCDLDNVVDAILGQIVAALAVGGRVELRGFGVFSVKGRRARAGRNPRTGVPVEVNQKSFPHFRTSKEMHKRLNGPGAV